jgi:hypothetical protein
MNFSNRIDQALQRLDESAKLFSQIIADLQKTGIKFYVVGGVAVTYHGWERLTRDIDVVIDQDDFDKLDSQDFRKKITPGSNFGNLLHKKTGMQVDVLLGGGIFPKTSEIKSSLANPHIASLTDLIIIKLRRGDPSDIGDIYRVLKVTKEPVDWKKVKDKVQRDVWNDLTKIIKRVETERGTIES